MHTPTPRVALGCAMDRRAWRSGIAHSDGLVGDLGHILKASQAAPRSTSKPCLPASAARQETGGRSIRAGGDDYELCFTAPASSRDAIAALAASCGTAATRVGSIEAKAGLRLVDAAGQSLDLQLSSFDHFTD